MGINDNCTVIVFFRVIAELLNVRIMASHDLSGDIFSESIIASHIEMTHSRHLPRIPDNIDSPAPNDPNYTTTRHTK